MESTNPITHYFSTQKRANTKRMETPRFRRIIVKDEEGSTYIIKKKWLILRHSNGLFYDYYIYTPYHTVKVESFRVLKEHDNPDLSSVKRLFEISDGVLFNTRYFDTLLHKDHTILTTIEESPNLLPVLRVEKSRVSAFLESAMY
jgi:hypothetical protein